MYASIFAFAADRAAKLVKSSERARRARGHLSAMGGHLPAVRPL